jgi:hypothetical protein
LNGVDMVRYDNTMCVSVFVVGISDNYGTWLSNSGQLCV